jgi:hypothetical protein
MADECDKMNEPTFISFPKLPIELRLKIWNFYTPPPCVIMPVRFIRHGYFHPGAITISTSTALSQLPCSSATRLGTYSSTRTASAKIGPTSFVSLAQKMLLSTSRHCTIVSGQHHKVRTPKMKKNFAEHHPELSRLKVKKELRTVILESKDFHRMSPWGTGESFNLLMPFSSLEVFWIMLCSLNNAGLEYIREVDREVDLDSTSLTRSRSVVQEDQDRIEALFERTKTTHPEWRDPALKFRLDFKFLREMADYRSCVRYRKE